MHFARLISFVILILSCIGLNAQYKIGASGTPSDTSAILEIESSSRGILFPRMTTSERDAIVSPATSLLIYNTDRQGLEYYDSSGWMSLSPGDCAPSAPGEIFGNELQCAGQAGLIYWISPVQGATSYHWIVPSGYTIAGGQGTESIIVDIGTQGGDIMVRAESGCGVSTYISKSITVTTNLPAQPGSISGNSIVEDNAAGESYSISAVSGATSYAWDVPAGATIASGQGTTSILVNFGTASGNISVHATNVCGNSDTSYLSVQVFGCGDVFTDTLNNYSYHTVSISNQCWFAENLLTGRYNDGISVPLVTSNTSWQSISSPAYCWYNNDSTTYGSVYGALYNWYAVNDGNLCPSGWHVPSISEWTTLTAYLGGEATAGGELKETGTTHWLSPNTGATNSTGFTALPGGKREGDGTFNSIGSNGFWWSTTLINLFVAVDLIMYHDSEDAANSGYMKSAGLSVRCVKD